MSAYVVDASVLIQYAIMQQYTPEARILISQLYQGDRLHLPEVLLTGMHKRSLESRSIRWVIR